MIKLKSYGLITLLLMSLNSLSISADSTQDKNYESAAKEKNNIGINVGNIAPDFTLTNLNKETFTLSDFRGKKPVYLIFWATWCSTCKHEIPQITALHQTLGDQIEILAINVDFLSWWSSLNKSDKRVEKYVKKYEIAYTVALDDEETLINLYKVRGTPTQILIDKDGVIRRRYGLLNGKTITMIKSMLEDQMMQQSH